ncbi:PaaI family thioesterase [Paenibacillus donghaensis]|uniref:PaaI family thioesterase n=1 Tax=Paenibacillus donghaensis TaxID=414771 RepID=UPI001883C0CB|nr:PaaI family thioesterase [Paenibacillus donghaensis]MBE9913527.1 PaaI family thioesterase [Paenibacillus donghaensis]
MEITSGSSFPDLKRLEQAAKDTFWDYIGCEIVEVNEKEVVVGFDIRPHHLNLIGILHGGMHASAIDSAMGIIVMLARPNTSAVTVGLNMNYVAPVTEGRVLVTAELIHSSRKLITAQAYARKENGDLLAFGTGTFRVLDKISS